MYNFLDKVKESPAFFRQIAVNEQLITEYNCPINTHKAGIWADQNYFVYVTEGKKIWHIPGKSFELTEGKCIFVKKGAHLVEQFFDTRFCVVIFFVSDRFITDTIRIHDSEELSIPNNQDYSTITPIDTDDSLHAFFNSIVPYFLQNRDTNKALLELKFKELILNVIGNSKNHLTKSYFYSLLSDASSESMRKIMEENFLYNLKLEEFAKLCCRSLSAFKRDFVLHFNTTPGRWILDRRLKHAQILRNTTEKSISEIAFESGFENISHFSKAFKDCFGISPSKYRT